MTIITANFDDKKGLYDSKSQFTEECKVILQAAAHEHHSCACEAANGVCGDPSSKTPFEESGKHRHDSRER